MEKENMPVIDFSEFPAPDSETFIMMPDENFEQYEICCEYIQLGTSVPIGTKVESGFFCRQEMSDGELCDGTIEVTNLNDPNQIRWECRKCGDMGAIFNHEDSVWDNSYLSEKEKELFLDLFFNEMDGDDFFEDEFFDLYQGHILGPFFDFEYFVNLNDPDGVSSGDPPAELIEEMLNCNWTNPQSLIYLNDSLTPAQAKKSFIFVNARQFLLTLQEEGEFPLTRTGYLKRHTVRSLIRKGQWPDYYMNEYKNNADETDVWLLHGVRILLDLAGLIKENNQTYRLNEEKRYLLDEENAGQLYRLLFSTYFKEMNLGYLGSTIELPYLQYSVPFILYKLQKMAKDWVSMEELIPELLLYSVTLELQIDEVDTGIAHDLLYDDLITPLEYFGLLEIREKSANTPDQIRITPMFQEFIELKVEDSRLKIQN
ncbi:MAG: hypothetical protein WEA58_07735 [Balneolaceae bacterium]